MARIAVFCLLLVMAFIIFARNCRRIAQNLAIGKKENRGGYITARLKNVLFVAFGQSKLLRDPLAGIMHFFMFWGFIILLSSVFEAVVQGFYPQFSLKSLGSAYLPLAIAQETIGALVMLSCLLALMRWHLFMPKRFFGREITGPVRRDATLILFLILTIMLSMFAANATRMALTGHLDYARFLSVRLAAVLIPTGPGQAIYELFWWIHILVIFGFLAYLPHSKHLHILTSIPNVFFASLKPAGELSPLNFEDESVEKFGVADVQDFTWKQLLDGFTCTDCGRCTAACPASITGKSLSPRKIIMNVRERAAELVPILDNPQSAGCERLRAHRLLDSFIAEQELWDCTTCRACMQECPVMIEHVPSILDMRRYLVLTESRFPQEMTPAYKSLETNYSPWAFSPESREDWAKGLDVRIMAEIKGKAEILYWVGCAGAFDARYQKVARAMVRLLNAAAVDFAILGKEEKCNGDHARRSGNEYLAQMLITENIETLNRYSVKKIVATCPHCFNILANEYPQFGGTFEVLHHAVFLNQLIRSGALKITEKQTRRVTFHDSCYVGRYNGIYHAPRDLISRSGAHLVEMARSRSRGLCCGAGGARMFMEETTGKRINEERIDEVLRCNPQSLATECPFCMTMLTDGMKARSAEDKIQVCDIAELLADSLDQKNSG
jgi:Fe-S oxidoreductase